MSTFTIGPMRLEEVTLTEGLGHHLWRGKEYAGYFRNEIEGKLAAVRGSLLTDEQWASAIQYLYEAAEATLRRAA
jgi:hypothetical protein